MNESPDTIAMPRLSNLVEWLTAKPDRHILAQIPVKRSTRQRCGVHNRPKLLANQKATPSHTGHPGSGSWQGKRGK